MITDCEGEAFRSTGRNVKVMGWKALYQQEQPAKKTRGKKKAEDEEETAALPPLNAGDERTVKKADVQQSATKPPAPHTDASLLAAMEHAGREIEDEALRESMKGAGLGTPATRAAIIERLLQVGYAQRKGRAIMATDKGVQLIAVAPEEIASPEMTGKWELALDEIAKNQRDTERFMQGIRRMSAFLVEYARDRRAQVDFPEEMRRGKGGKRTAAVKPLPEAVLSPVRQARTGERQGLRLLRLEKRLPFHPVEGWPDPRRRPGAEREDRAAPAERRPGEGQHRGHRHRRRVPHLHAQRGRRRPARRGRSRGRRAVLLISVQAFI